MPPNAAACRRMPPPRPAARAPGVHGRNAGRGLLLVVLHDVGGADVGIVGVEAGRAASPALTQQVPALVELHLEGVEAGLGLGVETGAACGRALQGVLFGDQGRDPVEELAVVHAVERTADPRRPTMALGPERPSCRAMRIAEFQQLMVDTYGERDAVRGVPATVAWLTEELGELAQACRKGSRADQLHELGDVLAWLASLAAQLGLSLEEAAARYAAGCPRCAHLPCAC
jgi:NTP pyrophosphatase (non-canonical NTP hydrolase)